MLKTWALQTVSWWPVSCWSPHRTTLTPGKEAFIIHQVRLSFSIGGKILSFLSVIRVDFHYQLGEKASHSYQLSGQAFILNWGKRPLILISYHLSGQTFILHWGKSLSLSVFRVDFHSQSGGKAIILISYQGRLSFSIGVESLSFLSGQSFSLNLG